MHCYTQVGPYYTPDSLHTDSEQSEELSDHDGSSGSVCMSEEVSHAHCSSPTSSLAAVGQQQLPPQQQQQQQQQPALVEQPTCVAGVDSAPPVAQEGRYPKRQRNKTR